MVERTTVGSPGVEEVVTRTMDTEAEEEVGAGAEAADTAHPVPGIRDRGSLREVEHHAPLLPMEEQQWVPSSLSPSKRSLTFGPRMRHILVGLGYLDVRKDPIPCSIPSSSDSSNMIVDATLFFVFFSLPSELAGEILFERRWLDETVPRTSRVSSSLRPLPDPGRIPRAIPLVQRKTCLVRKTRVRLSPFVPVRERAEGELESGWRSRSGGRLHEGYHRNGWRPPPRSRQTIRAPLPRRLSPHIPS